jgi:hypothetical protein
MNFRNTAYLLLLVVPLAMGACKKKIDFEYDNRPDTLPVSNSNTRLVNLAGYREIQIGDKRLTSFMQPNADGGYGTPGTMRVTKYFPETGQLSTTYSIPTEFIGGDGYIRNIYLSAMGSRDITPMIAPFDLKDQGRIPMDYYVACYTEKADYSEGVVFPVQRSVSASNNPANFRVRVLNLSSSPDQYGRQGNVTLSWADGTPVNTVTSHIQRGGYSDYIELPYGTHQLKILNDDGREVPYKSPGSLVGINIINPVTGTLMAIGEGDPGPAGFNDSWLTYAPLRTYQPGGVYTIVVSGMGGYGYANPGSNGEVLGVFTNCFQVINDVSEPVNSNYARVQGVNTIAGREVKWKIDGKDLGTTAYTAQTNYSAVIIGEHTMQVTDLQGAVLAEQKISLQAGDNISAWSYLTKNGAAAISISSNNLSGIYSLAVNGNDGSYAGKKDAFPYWVQFMNFCPDLDEATFTARNGTPLSGESSRHVLFGKAKTEYVYTSMGRNFSTELLVYASTPSITPGNWVSSITPLKASTFIKNIDLYKTPNKPNSESGIYTVALVGSTAAGATEKAKLILIKHNQ